MTSDRQEIRISGNGLIQRHQYDPKMNDTRWRPTIWYACERNEKREDGGDD